MNIPSEILLSVLSTGVGLTGLYFAFNKFNNDVRDRLLMEKKQIALMEQSIINLQRSTEELNKKIDLVFEKMDARTDLIERQHYENQAVLRSVLDQCKR